jgi:tRNA-Thr(GGU) m(6)t(6)A37 methyltransferase TsaA
MLGNDASDGLTMTGDRSDIRPGEVKTALPERFDAALYFIGRIRTPWTRRTTVRRTRASPMPCARSSSTRAGRRRSEGVETCSHLVVLYWMDKARRDLLVQAPRHYSEPRATFALRSPARPNPIALSVVSLLRIEGTRLSVVGLDCLDGTPLLDLKPYFASVDAVADAKVGWHAERKG